MGSKRFLLRNGFGERIVQEASRHERVVDLFTGSAAVAWFAAERVEAEVLAVDLQHYARTLAEAVVGRTTRRNAIRLRETWVQPLRERPRTFRGIRLTSSDVHRARAASSQSSYPLVRAYGGHYFSPEQASVLQQAADTLPLERRDRAVCLAALIMAASRCAAAPGHTAQPFQPTGSALPYIEAAWSRDPLETIDQAMVAIAEKRARTKGRALVADAVDVARSLDRRDLVIIDPPYSAVQYSRFYHVLETIAREDVGPVSGVGRYPDPAKRPRSRFSLKSEAKVAFVELLDVVAEAGSSALVTFPAGNCSNGVSGSWLAKEARKRFTVEQACVLGRFSTLGGNGTARNARTASAELILTLRPNSMA